METGAESLGHVPIMVSLVVACTQPLLELRITAPIPAVRLTVVYQSWML